jgi:hypothetical protein
VFIDGISGEILQYTLRKILGDAFTPTAHRGWIKIYSRMLDHIVPCAVEFEVHNKELYTTIQENRSQLRVVNQEPVFSASKTTHVVSKDDGSRPAVLTST